MRAWGVAAATSAAILGVISSAAAWPSESAITSPPVIAIMITAPRSGASYERGSRIVAHFRCEEGGSTMPISSCKGTSPNGHPINTRSAGSTTFTVSASDTSGNQLAKSIHYVVWTYGNPLHAVADLRASRIDMGVDYSGSGPILAIGDAKVVFASNNVGGA